MVEKLGCIGCKFNGETQGSYCYCKRKRNRVRMTDRSECKYAEEQIEEKWFGKILKMCEFKGEHKSGKRNY